MTAREFICGRVFRFLWRAILILYQDNKDGNDNKDNDDKDNDDSDMGQLVETGRDGDFPDPTRVREISIKDQEED